MGYMFFYASAFNQDISAWHVASVENMVAMFRYASAFNQSFCWDLLPATSSPLSTIYKGPRYSIYNGDTCECTAEQYRDQSTGTEGVCVNQPTREPSSVPSGEPSSVPSGEPTGQPTGVPSSGPSKEQSSVPAGEPSSEFTDLHISFFVVAGTAVCAVMILICLFKFGYFDVCIWSSSQKKDEKLLTHKEQDTRKVCDVESGQRAEAGL
jgi:hypothetical protein